MNKILNTQATYTVSVDQAVTFGAEKAVLTATEHCNIRVKKKHKMTHSWLNCLLSLCNFWVAGQNVVDT